MQHLPLRLFTSLLLVLIAASCSKTESWSDIVKIDDGSTTTVERSVKLTFTGGELSQAAARHPAYYQLRAKNPKNGQAVSWTGTFGIIPIAIAFTPQKTYLVTLAFHCDAEIKKFSIRDFPYVFQESTNGMAWKIVHPSEVPTEIRSANLSSDSRPNGETLQPDRIDRTNRAMEFSSDMYYAREIPRSPSEWKYAYKNKPLCG